MASTTARTPYQVTFLVLAVAVGAFALIQSLTIPVLGVIEHTFDTDQSTTTWVLTAYLLSASVCTPIVGRIGNAVGKERMLVFSLTMLSLGSLLAALAPNIGFLIAARAVQGVGGGVLPVSFGIIRDEFPRKRVEGAVSIISSLLAAGIGCGIVLAGPIVNGLGFRWLFWLPCIITAVAAIVAFLFVPESPARTPGRISVWSAILLAAALIALLVGISQAPRWGWTSPPVVGLLLTAVAIGVLWVRNDIRAAVPLVDMRMMRIPAVLSANLVAFLVGFGLYATSSFLPQFVQTPESEGYGFGITATQSGMLMLPSALASFVIGLVAAPLAARIGSKTAVVLGSATAGMSVVSIALIHEKMWQIGLAYLFSGVGIGLVFACLANLVVAAVPATQTGIASGMNTNIRTIGGAIGSAVLSSVIAAGTLVHAMPSEDGYTHGFLLIGVALLLAALAGLSIPRASGRLTTTAPAPVDNRCAVPATGTCR